MKKALLLLFLFMSLLSFGQDRRGNLEVGLNSRLENHKISDLEIDPVIRLFLTNDFMVSVTGYYLSVNGEKSRMTNVSGRLYLSGGYFGQVGYGTDFGGFNELAFQTGYTSWLGRFYIEPVVNYSIVKDNHRVALGLGCGLRLN